MRFPKRVELLFVPTDTNAEAHVIALTELRIRRGMGDVWWNDPRLSASAAAKEIDRRWDWTAREIERGGRVLASRKLGVVTGDGAIQGAMLVSTEPVPCERENNRDSLFVELLFTAPRNRPWIRVDHAEQYRGVGVELLRTAAELSLESGLQGRLKLESSPDFVDWYRKRGLLEVSANRILYEDVKYTPMELQTDRVSILLPDR
jgi:hypothetical protein